MSRMEDEWNKFMKDNCRKCTAIEWQKRRCEHRDSHRCKFTNRLDEMRYEMVNKGDDVDEIHKRNRTR